MDNKIHYRATVKMTSNNENIKLVIPSILNIDNAFFSIVNIGGKLSTAGSQLIHIHSQNLINFHSYTSYNEQYDLIGRAVLSDTVSLDNTTENKHFCPYTTQNNHCPTINFRLTGEDYLPLANVSFVEFDIVIVGERL